MSERLITCKDCKHWYDVKEENLLTKNCCTASCNFWWSELWNLMGGESITDKIYDFYTVDTGANFGCNKAEKKDNE